MPRKRWNNDTAFPKRRLHLNLLTPSDDDDLGYNFKFLTPQEAQKKDADNFWFAAGDILNLTEEYEVNDYLCILQLKMFQLVVNNFQPFSEPTLSN